MSSVLYRAMLSKVKALLKVEAQHNAEERKAQQWQLLFEIDGTQWIIGKGGVNTTFYQIGSAERVLLYPDELLNFLESNVRSKYSSYSVVNSKGVVRKSGFTSESSALKVQAKLGYYIVGHSGEGPVKLYKRQSGVFKDEWVPYKAK